MSATPRRLVFGEVAELYDASRPTYPDALIDDLVAWAGDPPRALEVGAGTGKATRLMAARGVAVLAIEPSAEMAAVARRTTAQYPGIEIVESDFERWDPAGRRFELIYAGQAWHWVDHATAYDHARTALRDGGRLVAFWNRPGWAASALRDELAAVYRRIVPELDRDGPMHPANRLRSGAEEEWEERVAATDGLGEPEVRGYQWSLDYSPDQYTDLLSTLSEIRLLDEDRRRELLDAVKTAVAAHGDRLTMDMVTRAYVARAV